MRDGKMTLRTDHFASLLQLLSTRRAELQRAEKELREWLTQQPLDQNRK